jgi:putative membrane protein
MKTNRFFKQFNWRFLLVRILVNAIALAVTAAIVPRIYFVDKSIWNWLLMAFMLGVLNALVKPILQVLTLQFIFFTYGLVIVLVNALLLWLLSFLFPARFAVDSLLWALVGGLVLGLLSSFLESLLGLTMPIVPDEPPQLRRQLEEQARQVDWLAAANREAAYEEQAPGLDAGPEETGTGEGQVTSQPRATVPELSTPEPGEEPASGDAAPAGEAGPSPPEEVGAEPSDSVATPPAEAAISVGREPAPEPDEEKKEDRS